MLRDNRKNIQYLKSYELNRIREVIDDGRLSLRDKCIMLLLLYTGLRSSDIAALKMESIDWAGDRILVRQQKTDEALILPLSPVVGNSIYDYLSMERPNTNSNRLFLTSTSHNPPLASASISAIVAKVFAVAGIRQNPGDRKGTHIFRHNLASSLLSKGVPGPVIAQTLGHSTPESLEPYLRADFAHLKECSISIEDFPLNKGVLSV